MAHSKEVWEISGKRASLLVPISIFVAIATLIGLIALVFIKANNFDESLGDRQLGLFTIYQTGEKYLHLVDGAAMIAVKPALLKVADTGLKKSSPCGSYVDKGKAYAIWAARGLDAACQPESVPVPCYPDAKEAKDYLADTFRPEFESIIKEFNNAKKDGIGTLSANIPEEYEKFYVGSGVKPTIIGIAKGPIVLERVSVKKPKLRLLQYNITPSFNEPIEVNFLQDSTTLVEVAKQLFGKSEKDAKDLVSSVDGQNGLDWDEKFSYGKAADSCAHSVGSCSCCKKEKECTEFVNNEAGDLECIKWKDAEVSAPDGVLHETIPYDSVGIPMSVKVNDPDSDTGHKQFFVYDETAKKVIPKELEYRFALSWIEPYPDKATTFCSCSEGYPCGAGPSDD